VQAACAVGLEEILARPGSASDRNARPVGIDHKLFPREPVVALGSTHFEVTCAVDAQLFRQCMRKARQPDGGTLQQRLKRDPHGAVQSHLIRTDPLLKRTTEVTQAPCNRIARLIASLLHKDQHLAVGPQPQLRLLCAQAMQPPCCLGSQPLLHRKVVGGSQGVGIADADRLIIGELAKLGFAVFERSKAQVGYHLHLLRRRVPRCVVASGAVHRLYKGFHIDPRGFRTGDPASDVDMIAMHCHLDANQRARIAPPGFLHQCIGDGVAEFVGVSRKDVFSGVKACGHDGSPVGMTAV